MAKKLNVANKNKTQTDYAYWQKKTIQERIDAIELLRSQFIQLQKDVYQGVQRVYTIVKRK
jgi:hypothetical protein